MSQLADAHALQKAVIAASLAEARLKAAKERYMRYAPVKVGDIVDVPGKPYRFRVEKVRLVLTVSEEFRWRATGRRVLKNGEPGVGRWIRDYGLDDE